MGNSLFPVRGCRLIFLLSSAWHPVVTLPESPAMPHRFPDLAPPQRAKSRALSIVQTLPLGEIGVALLIGLALMLA